MICERCQRPIEPGQLYLEARMRPRDPDFCVTLDEISPHPVHIECPTVVEIVDGRVLMNGLDIGPFAQFDVSHG